MGKTGKDGGQQWYHIRLGFAIQCFAKCLDAFKTGDTFLHIGAFFNTRAKLFGFRNAVFALGSISFSETHFCSDTLVQKRAGNEGRS